MNELISILREKNKPLEIEIPAMPSWDGFDKLIDFLIKEYNAVASLKADGPDARRWILESNGSQFELVYDDLTGNSLVAPSVDSEELILTIARDLEERLTGDIVMIDTDIHARILKTGENVILTFWCDGQDLTKKIYEALQNQQSNLKDVQLFGAPYSYDLLMVPLESSDQLLNDIKMMDKIDLEKHACEETEWDRGEVPLIAERVCEFNRVFKIENAQRGLLTHIEAVKNRLLHTIPTRERHALEKELSEANQLLDDTEEFMLEIAETLTK